MGPGLQLTQRLSQSLGLAPQLQQSLALLQAPTLELKALVEAELQQNPVLEEGQESDEDSREKRSEGRGRRSRPRLRPGGAAGRCEVRFRPEKKIYRAGGRFSG